MYGETDFEKLYSITQRNFEEILQGIAVSESGEIAVAFNKEIDIYSMKPAENFQYTRKIYTREPITSIASLNDNLAILFVQKTDNSSSGDSNINSDDNNDDDYEITVQIRTFRNKILADKTDFAEAKGQTMVFSEPKSIHVHKNEEIMILEKRQFKVFDIDGRLKWYYKFHLQHLSGITLD